MFHREGSSFMQKKQDDTVVTRIGRKRRHRYQPQVQPCMDEIIPRLDTATAMKTCNIVQSENDSRKLERENDHHFCRKTASSPSFAKWIAVFVVLTLFKDCYSFASWTCPVPRHERSSHLLHQAVKEPPAEINSSKDSKDNFVMGNDEVCDNSNNAQLGVVDADSNSLKEDKTIFSAKKDDVHDNFCNHQQKHLKQATTRSTTSSTKNYGKRHRLNLTDSIIAAIRKRTFSSSQPKKPSNLKRNKSSSSSSSSCTKEKKGERNSLLQGPAHETASKIQATISDMLTTQLNKHAVDSAATNAADSTLSSSPPQVSTKASMGVLGDVTSLDLGGHATASVAPAFFTDPKPGTVLVSPKKDEMNPVTVRVATSMDDVDIANLRLSVFSDFAPDVRRQFCSRSCKAIHNRRMQGAACVVAKVPSSGTDVIVGSAECSFHEFFGTELGRQRRPGTILYVTEVAVSPFARRRGIGAKLMKAIDKLATIRKIETIYLHVDVTNDIANALYEKAGYNQIKSSSPQSEIFYEFTKSLNLHDGATKGRNHFLLYKDFTNCPTFNQEEEKGATATSSSSIRQRQQRPRREPLQPKKAAGARTLGFEIPV